MPFTQRFPIALLLLSTCLQVKAQKADSLLAAYSMRIQHEKAYLQFDKTVYNSGDTIWYKAYILAGTDPSEYSNSLYVDWFTEDGKLLKHTANPMFESGSKGQFTIPADYKERSIQLKAYTKWMLNFDTDFIYRNAIPVARESAMNKSNGSPQTSIQFFPEGGDLVAGLLCRVAFKALDEQGMPVFVKGKILNHSGETIVSFTSEHDGMGSFSIEPKENAGYTAQWTDILGNSYSTSLPTIRNNGLILEVTPQAASDKIIVKRTATVPDELKILHLVAHMNLHPVFSATVNLVNKVSVESEIPTASLPSGVLQFTLFNANWLPVSERVAFVNNREYAFETKISTPVKSVEKRGKNILEIAVTDSAASNLSVSVTDASLNSENKFSNTIFTQLLLCSELKGFIYQPGYYFSAEDDSIYHHLDLVMLTHGWRRFNWEAFRQNKVPELLFEKDSGFITITGLVANIEKFKLPADGQKITLLLEGKDSSQQVYKPRLDSKGKFSQSINNFLDSFKVYYQFANHPKLQDKGNILLSTDLLPYRTDHIYAINKTGHTSEIDSTTLYNSLFLGSETINSEKDKNSHLLSDVTIRAAAKKKAQLLDEEYTSGMFRGQGQLLDISNDPKYTQALTIAQYLTNKVPGLQVNYDKTGNPLFSWRGDATDVYVDEQYMGSTSLKMIDGTNIGYIKVFPPGFAGGFSNLHAGGSPGGVIALYTKHGNVNNIMYAAFKLKQLEGYTPFKEFYSPDYAKTPAGLFKDTRSTLYWNPFIVSSVSGHTLRLEFYNNDYSKKLRVVLEGINADGRMTRTEKFIE